MVACLHLQLADAWSLLQLGSLLRLARRGVGAITGAAGAAAGKAAAAAHASKAAVASRLGGGGGAEANRGGSLAPALAGVGGSKHRLDGAETIALMETAYQRQQQEPSGSAGRRLFGMSPLAVWH